MTHLTSLSIFYDENFKKKKKDDWLWFCVEAQLGLRKGEKEDTIKN